MAGSSAATPEAYLAEQPPERAQLLGRVRKLVDASLPPGYEQRMNWGMICWELPLAAYPVTYNKQPLLCVALAAQKSYNALYLSCVYASESRNARLREAYQAAGRKLDMGKSCLRFRRWEDLLPDAIAEVLGDVTVESLIADYEKAHGKRGV